MPPQLTAGNTRRVTEDMAVDGGKNVNCHRTRRDVQLLQPPLTVCICARRVLRVLPPRIPNAERDIDGVVFVAGVNADNDSLGWRFKHSM